MPVREKRRPLASSPIIIHEYASSKSSSSQRISDAALSSPDDSMQEPDLASDLEQFEDPYRPMTPGEEEIMRIYEDEVYRSSETLLIVEQPFTDLL